MNFRDMGKIEEPFKAVLVVLYHSDWRLGGFGTKNKILSVERFVCFVKC
tara:strand:- start:485 stop:631 length:147 start_codon:yes stop_codon:yes gene_type:complete